MADPNISKHTIEDVQAAITRRLSPYPPDDCRGNASASRKAIDKQDRELARRELSHGMLGLLAVGYIITTAMLLLSGWQVSGFYLEPYVLAVLIGSSMGSSAYMFRRVMDVVFG